MEHNTGYTVFVRTRNLLQAFAQEADDSDISNGHAMAAYRIIKGFADTLGVERITPAVMAIDLIQNIAKQLFADSKTG